MSASGPSGPLVYNLHSCTWNLVRTLSQAQELMLLLSKFESDGPTVLANGRILRSWQSFCFI